MPMAQIAQASAGTKTISADAITLSPPAQHIINDFINNVSWPTLLSLFLQSFMTGASHIHLTYCKVNRVQYLFRKAQPVPSSNFTGFHGDTTSPKAFINRFLVCWSDHLLHGISWHIMAMAQRMVHLSL